MEGQGRSMGPVFGSPTHLVMPNPVVLWKVSPSRGGRRAGSYKPGQTVAAGRGPRRRRADPRGDSPAIWLAGGGQGRAAAADAKPIYHASGAPSL
jgi:hypothetical protein